MANYDAGKVKLVKQANNAQCWYASACMMYGFRGKKIKAIGDLGAGDASDEGLWTFAAAGVLVSKLGFKSVPSGDLKGLSSELLAALMMSVKGPMLCLGEYQPGVPGAGHAMVVYKVSGETVHYADPFEPREKEIAFGTFNSKLFKEMSPSCCLWI